MPSHTQSGSSIIDGVAGAEGVKAVAGEMGKYRGEAGEKGLEIGGGEGYLYHLLDLLFPMRRYRNKSLENPSFLHFSTFLWVFFKY